MICSAVQHIPRVSILSLAGTVLVSALTATAFAGEINTGYFGDVAIKGYDPVGYFKQRRAVKGSEKYSLKWLGATWLFASDEHRQLFESSPTEFAPQYGGHCADGVAYGDYTANIDPEAWRIIDGKLYLSYDPGSAEEHEKAPGMREKAEKNWPKYRPRLLAGQSASLHN
jgi:YHS domain-containing protein